MAIKPKKQIVFVWLALVVMTVVLWGMGWEHGLVRNGRPSLAMAGILAIAFFKTQLVATFFMELRTAPMPLRVAFSAWVVGVGAALIAIYLIA